MADLLIANQRQECGVSAPYLLKLRVEQDFLFRLQTESNSGSLNLDPAEIRVFKNTLGDFEAPEKKKAQPGAEAASAAACATGFYVSHDAQKHIEKNSVLA